MAELSDSTTGVRPAAAGEHVLSAGPYTAAIDEIGATLRLLRHGDDDLVASFPAGTMRPLYRGATIAPWPNRIVDGRYSFDGEDLQLPVNEVDRHHALHGLVHWIRWDVTDVGVGHVVLEHHLVPQQGYPFPLHLTVHYRLTSDGLEATTTAVNTGSGAAPYGYCPHPYLVAGPGTVDGWSLELPAALRLDTDDRLAPRGTVPVDFADSDFRVADVIGERQIDHAFTALDRDAGGRATVRVRAPGGSGVQMTFGPWAPWVQVHTADRPEPEYNRAGLAVEPMSCPPDAFNSTQDLVVLQPNDSHVAEWTISAVDTVADPERTGA
ncbi:aldose 1-epimerase family protein [Nakamurella sp. GG22]